MQPKKFLNTDTNSIFVGNDFYEKNKKGIYENIKLPNTNHICYKYPKAVGSIYQKDFEQKDGLKPDQFILDHEMNNMRKSTFKGKLNLQSTKQADYQPFEVSKKKGKKDKELDEVQRDGLFSG